MNNAKVQSTVYMDLKYITILVVLDSHQSSLDRALTAKVEKMLNDLSINILREELRCKWVTQEAQKIL